MSLHIRCSGCQTVSQVPDNSQGKKARCPKCGAIVQIPVLATAMPVMKAVAPLPIAVPAPPVPPKTQPEGMPSAAKPQPTAMPLAMPKPNAMPPEAPDEPDAFHFGPGAASETSPVRRARPSAPARRPRWLYVAVGGVLLVLVGVGISIFTGGSTPLEAKPTAQTSQPPQKAADTNAEQVVAKSSPALTKEEGEPAATPNEEIKLVAEIKPAPSRPKLVPLPSRETPASIVAAVTQKVKKATTYLKVTMPNGQSVEGSGFFAAERGLVFTNAHVLGMMGHATAFPAKVDIVVNSGETDEFRREGQVLGVDRVNDLGILKVFGSQEELPEPLPVDTTRTLGELQKVYVFGFPLGAALGKNITVSESSISSLRKEGDGVVNQIQVNGGMHPGNSGGPVVDARGVVVGVAVAVIRGTQINFAVPGEKVLALLRAQAGEINFSDTYFEGAVTKLPVQVTCLDPLGRLQGVKLDVWTGEDGAGRPSSAAKPEARPGDGPKKTVPLPLAKGKAAIDVPLPHLGTGKVIWIQPVFTDVWGETHWGAATTHVPSEYPPLTRKPALIQQKFDTQPQRTVKWSSSLQFHISKGAKPGNVGESLLEVDALEMAKADPQGGYLDVFVSAANVSTLVEGKKVGLGTKGIDSLRARYFTFVANPAGTIVQRTLPRLPSPSSVGAQANFTTNANRVCKSYEMTSLPMPNKEVAPMETWPAVVPMVVFGDGRNEFVNAALTCTYEGTRLVRGKQQAMISLAGNLQKQNGKGNVGGNVMGKVHFALDAGYLSEAKLKVETDIGDGTAYASYVMEVNLTRTPGNTLKVTPTPPPPALVKGKVIIDEAGTLDQNSPTNLTGRPGIAYKLFTPTLTAGVTYMIEMNKSDNTSDLDPYLILNDPKGKKVAEDDDGGGDLNSRIVFEAKETGVYRIVATAFQAEQQMGAFRLIVSEVSSSAK